MVFETNNYYLKLLLYIGFKLIKLKPRAEDGSRRMILSITKEQFEKMNEEGSIEKIMASKFYVIY